MASPLVDAVVEKLGGMLIEEINKEISLFCNFRNDVEWLKKKLTNIRGYLRDADAQSAHSDSVRSWLLKVAELAWDAEDIVDECALQLIKGTDTESPQSSCVLCAFSCSELLLRHKMARRIRNVKRRMRSIMEDAVELKLVRDLTHSEQPSTSTSGKIYRRGGSLIEKRSRPVAIEPKIQQLLYLLHDPASPDVIAIVGMGGAGKTFLIQNAFNRIKDKFEKSVWLSVSHSYSLARLQADLASELGVEHVVSGKVSEVQAAKLIHDKLLASKSCLVVLDDVWRANGEDDLIYALGLPMGNNNNNRSTQCKIVVTTRSRFVCRDLDARVYEMQLLSEEESWELFCAHAFPDCPQNQPPNKLEGIAREVEGECGRLPLAVKIVGASLAHKKLSTEWESKLAQLKAVSHVEDPVMQILKLSYDSLPPHLKPCFAFLSFFPEDEEIHSDYLINMWAAEGYIPQGDDDTLDIGWDYISHLHSLCLLEIQPFHHGDLNNYCSKLDTRYKLHDLVLDLAISISKESKCAFSVDEVMKKVPSRVLMVKKKIGNEDVVRMASNRAYSASRLRTLSLSRNEGIKSIPATSLAGAKLLRILDLSFTSISSLPACVENLKLLRFLNLRLTNITTVPECVRSNTNLRFLDISNCPSLQQLPNWIGELNCLQHLDIRGFRGFIPKEISKIISLQVIRSSFQEPTCMARNSYKLSVEDDGFLKLEHLVNLVNLREVHIVIDHDAQLKSIEDGILASLVKMRILILHNKVKCGNPPPLSEKMTAMKDLEVLFLVNFALPDWICAFSNLTKLYLRRTHCFTYPALEIIPNLMSLELTENKNCKALPQGFWKPKGFPQLCFFRISDFYELEELSETEIEEGAMPCLETLQVCSCPSLKRVPIGLELLKSLKNCDFELTGVTHLFEEGGELRNKMKATNPNLIIKTS